MKGVVALIVVDNPSLKVFERFQKEIEPIVGEGNLSMNASETIAKGKYARLLLMGMPTDRSDLEGNECSVNLSFQTEAFADGIFAQNDAYDIDSAIHKCMVGMGFRRTFGPEVLDNIDSRIKRVVSRYGRVYTGQLLGETTGA